MRAAVLALLIAFAAAPAAADEYPTALIDRPQLLPRGLVEIGAAVGHSTERALGIEILSAETAEVGARVGISDRWELAAASSVWIHPDPRWERAVSLAAGYHAFAGERIDLAPRLELPLSFHHGYDLVDTAWLGLGLKARLSGRFFAIAGRRLLPIDIRPAFALHVAADGGVGYQATSALALLAETQLATLTMVGPIDRSTTAADRWPLALTALWATPAIDTAVELRTGDAFAPGNDFSILLSMGVRP